MNSRVGSVNLGLPRIVVWGGNEISNGEVMLDLFFIMVSIGESFLDHPHVLVTDEVADDPSEKLRESKSFFQAIAAAMLVRKVGFVTREMSRDIMEEFGRYALPERAVQLIENWMTNRVSFTHREQLYSVL